MSLFHHEPEIEILIIEEHDPEVVKLIKEIGNHVLRELRAIRRELRPRPTPVTISFKEITMLDPVAGNTLVYTGTLSPAGAQFPAGTSFSVTSNYPNVAPTVDATGLVVTVPLGSDFVDDPTNPLAISYATSSFFPEPSTSPAQITATITPTIPPPPTPTPTSINFVQTT